MHMEYMIEEKRVFITFGCGVVTRAICGTTEVSIGYRYDLRLVTQYDRFL